MRRMIAGFDRRLMTWAIDGAGEARPRRSLVVAETVIDPG
jgi:hypothetical protein